ncbi:MAG: hypothetical protein ACI8UO_006156 [Verrucomicrobiales bacterium]|jgi:hypothetical protein
MKFHFLILLICFITSAAIAQQNLTLSSQGASEYTIVRSAEATEPEKFAAEELSTFLERVTGAEFPVTIG